MTLAEWRTYLGLARPAPAVALPPDAAACWTETRRPGGGARLLAHRHALLPPSPALRCARGCTPVAGALGMLRVLRRGGTALLGARRAEPGALARTCAEVALP
ncbi:MAG TPA: hypothetical protein VGD76_19535, partial [Ramlibacter sp.]